MWHEALIEYFSKIEANVFKDNEMHHLGYRYHFQDRENRLIFRYDNTPHYPYLDTHPHHKHLLDEVHPTQQPSIIEVIAEVKNFI